MTDDLSAFFDTDGFAESITVDGASQLAIVDTFHELGLSGEVMSFVRAVMLPASAVPSVAPGSAVTVRGVAHVVRQIVLEPPDGALVSLTLART